MYAEHEVIGFDFVLNEVINILIGCLTEQRVNRFADELIARNNYEYRNAETHIAVKIYAGKPCYNQRNKYKCGGDNVIAAVSRGSFDCLGLYHPSELFVEERHPELDEY